AQSLARPGTGSWFVRNSYLVNFLFHRYQAARNPALKSYFPHLIAAYDGEVWERQRQRLKDLRDSVQARGGRLSVVTFPFLHALGPDYDYQFVHGKLDQLWRELKIPHVDLLSTYQDIPPSRLTVNPFDAHPNEYACKLAADALQPFFSPVPRPESQTSGTQ
ncbi:MAG TPA: hypothetical protein VN673_09455, partial [Clostridia bacterium]|nr:hypothetical protein [Clostridia bacterium]